MEYCSLRLSKTLTVNGRSVWNAPSCLILEPLPYKDNRWVIEVCGKDYEITPAMFHAFGGRTVALFVNGEAVLCEFEHIGFLYTLGLRGVRLKLVGGIKRYWGHAAWPPFMCGAELLQLVLAHSRPGSTLGPYQYPEPLVREFTELRGKRKLERKFAYYPGGDSLRLEVSIDYGANKKPRKTLNLPMYIDDPALTEIVSARTLIRPSFLEPASRVFASLPIAHWHRWPHCNKVHSDPGSEEEATHSLFDKMLVGWIAPCHCQALGTFSLHSSHAMDVAAIRYMWDVWLRSTRPH
jgi:hypothetical protein